MLIIEGLSKTYRSYSEEITVLKNINLTIDKGEFLCILGPSGCGKSTLIRCIAGFERFEGSVISDGKAVKKPGIDRMMVFQDFNQLYPWKTVEKNIQYPLKKQSIRDKKQLKAMSDDALRKVELEGKQKNYPHELSGGMKQRVAIAKALALKSDVILMDEPFAALDAMTRNKLQDELSLIHSQSEITVIFITHNIQEALTLGTRILVMDRNGNIIIDEINTIPKPVTPASEGYGETWNRLHEALGK